jgi:hypothetical protein
MSFYSYRAIATCNLDVEDAEQATRLVVNTALTDPAFKNNIPSDLATENDEELYVEFKQYIKVDGLGQVVVTVDTDENNFCSELFDFIANILAAIHTGTCLEINWSSWDSREGLSGGCDRYGPGGVFIEPIIEGKALDAIAALLRDFCAWPDNAQENAPSLILAIAAELKATGRKIFNDQN